MKAKKLSQLLPPGGPDPMGTNYRKWKAAKNKEIKEKTQLQPLPENGKVLTDVDTSVNEFSSVSTETLAEDQIFAAYEKGIASGNSPGRVLHDMKRNSPFDNKAVYRKYIQKYIEDNLIPAKVETAIIKAGRQRMMTEALASGDSATFAKLAGLAAKDPELNLQQKSPAISIKIGDLKEVMAGQETIEIDYAEVEDGKES
jgi:hypothetical protein